MTAGGRVGAVTKFVFRKIVWGKVLVNAGCSARLDGPSRRKTRMEVAHIWQIFRQVRAKQSPVAKEVGPHANTVSRVGAASSRWRNTTLSQSAPSNARPIQWPCNVCSVGQGGLPRLFFPPLRSWKELSDFSLHLVRMSAYPARSGVREAIRTCSY